jgi:hypothetical protein
MMGNGHFLSTPLATKVGRGQQCSGGGLAACLWERASSLYRWTAVAQRMINDACALGRGLSWPLCPEFGPVAFQREYRLTEAGGTDAVVV